MNQLHAIQEKKNTFKQLLFKTSIESHRKLWLYSMFQPVFYLK